MHLDPVEKKPLYHFYPGALTLSVGTVGCSFLCSFCQNHGMSMDRPGRAVASFKGKGFATEIEDYCFDTTEGGILSPQAVVKACLDYSARIISFTYNEPSIWFEYARDISILAKAKGIVCTYVSNGYESPEQLAQLPGMIAAANIDLKCFREETYKRIMGGSLEPVKRTIEYLYSHGVVTEVTTLVVPQMNDSEEELRDIAQYLAGISKDIPWHVSAFHPDYQMTDRRATPAKTIIRACELGKEAGLHYVYAGNVYDTGFEATKCPGCKADLISRRGFHSLPLCISGNKCERCGRAIYGRFGE